jgi:peptide/nickel transport system substrate-binding protein
LPGRLGPGSTIDGYEIEEHIATGGMAMVYRARDVRLGRIAALKVLFPERAADAQFRARFLRESQMAAGVDHPHVLPVYGAGEADGVLYIATRFVPGGDLGDVVDRSGGLLAPERAAAIITQVAGALDAAHGAGLVHRDVKPGNVLIDTVAGQEHAYLSDFGLTRDTSVSSGLTAAGVFLGTPDYCAPEQILDRPLDGRADQYALGGVAYYLLTGTRPFPRSQLFATLASHLNDPVPAASSLRPGLPSAADAVLARALAKDPQDRFGSCAELATALTRALAAPGTDPERQQPRRRHRTVLITAAVAAVGVAAVGTTLTLPRSTGTPPGSAATRPAGSRSTGSATPARTAAPTGAASAGYDAALTSVVNPSSRRGGTLTLADPGSPDSLDPVNMHSRWEWDFSRLYATPLVTYKSAPGDAGAALVPGIATSLGQVSDGGLTWTYHIKHGLRLSDGEPVTAADVKYAVERSYDTTVFQSGPRYFQYLLADPGYPGPYRAPNTDLTSVTTPDPDTIQFHLTAPFADFDHVAALPQTAPVPRARDTGARYQLDPVSSGPYEFQGYQLGSQASLVPNPYFTPQEDTEARQLLRTITITFGVSDVDAALLDGQIDLDASGAGVEAATQAQILASATLRSDADDPIAGNLQFAYLSTQLPPLGNPACRQAIEYAASKSALQAAYGGPADESIATTLLLPGTSGYTPFDLYHAGSRPDGDLADARRALASCGRPQGFTVTAAFQSGSVQETAAAHALQAALARVGITLQLHGYPQAGYFNDILGSPGYVLQHGLAVDFAGWGSDWLDGYAQLDQLIDGDARFSTGNSNVSELNDPVVNSLLTQANDSSLSAAARSARYGQADLQAMKDAAILPMVDARVLLYRNPRLTNVYVESAYGMYNYAVLGLSDSAAHLH